MVDRETVIKELARCLNNDRECEKCFYRNETFCTEVLMYDAMELLKEQEPVKPTYEDFFGNRIARCGKCNGYIVRYKYCPGCGRAVKWE